MKKKFKIGILGLALLLGTTGCTSNLKDKDGKVIVNPVTGQSLTENILCKPTDEETIKLYEDNGYDLSSLPSCVCKDTKDNKEKNKENEEIKETEEEKNSKETEEKKETEKKEDKKESKDTKETKTDKETTETEEETGAEEAKNETKESSECQEFTAFNGKYEGLWTSIFVKPLAWVILLFGKYTGSFGLGLILTSILIRLIVYPLTKKSTMQTEQMKKIQPELDRLEKKYAGKDQNDREVMMMKSQEMMAIYKKYNVNPVSGCLPALLQLPLFIAFLDAINKVPAIFEEKFLLFHLGTTPMVGIKAGNWLYLILTVLVAVSTYFSMNKASQGTTSSNQNGVDMAKQTKMMMNMFTIMIIVMSVFMSSALNIYWVVSNCCTLLQNYLVKRSMK